MFFNVLIQVEGGEQLVTDFFYYDEKGHYLNYHSPYQAVHLCTISDVVCEIEVEKPMIFVRAKYIEG